MNAKISVTCNKGKILINRPKIGLITVEDFPTLHIFLDRSLNATEIALDINAALHGEKRYCWFID